MVFLTLPIGVACFSAYLIGFFGCHYLDTRESKHKPRSKMQTAESSIELTIKQKKDESCDDNSSPEDTLVFPDQVLPPPKNLIPFIRQEYIIGMLWQSKPQVTRTVTWTKLYTALLLEITIAGLVINDNDDENLIWEDVLNPLAQLNPFDDFYITLLLAIPVG